MLDMNFKRFFSLLVVLAAIWLLNKHSWQRAAFLGIVSGLAVSAKHPAVFTVLAVFGACGICALIPMSARLTQMRRLRRIIPEITTTGQSLLLRLVVAGVLAGVVFYALNPICWGDPVTRAGQVYEARKGILDGQVAAFGGYDDPIDQLTGFGRQVFVGHPQYYEADDWANYLSDQIDRYEASVWQGIGLGEFLPGAIVLALLAVMGWQACWHSAQGITPARWILAIWAIVILAESLVLTPLEWQRYYLMAYPIMGLLAATGAVWLFEPVPITPVQRIRLDLPDAGS